MKKKCARCGKMKLLKDFYKEPRVKDGRMSRCKVCHAKISLECRRASGQQKRYYYANLIKIRKYNREYQKAFRKENLILARSREQVYRDSHKVEMSVANKKYYARNRDKELLRVKKYQYENKSKINDQQRKYRELHKDRYRQHGRNWYKKAYATVEGRAGFIARNMTRRLREHQAGILTEAIITEIERENVIQYGILTCAYCKMPIEGAYHLEHKTPLSKGGTNRRVNLCVACPECNLSKGILTAFEYRAKLRAI